MIKKFKYLLLILLTFLIIPNVNAKEQVTIYLFWGDGCPHCEEEQTYLETIQKEFNNLEIKKYEVWNNKENEQFMDKIANQTNKTLRGVPVTIIGQTIITGFSDATKNQIRRAINYYSEVKHQDIVSEIKNDTYEITEEIPDKEFIKHEKKLNKKTTIKLPVINKVNFKNFEISTAIPILGVLACLSLPLAWLIITFVSIVSLQKEKKTKLKLLASGLILITISSILSSILNLNNTTWFVRILISCLCLLLIINKYKNLNISNNTLKIITILIAMMIGWLTPNNYWNILTELINSQSLSTGMTILSNIYYLLSFFLTSSLILVTCYTIFQKLSKSKQELIQVGILITTILVVIFL